ncbi:MAG: hypothetical protein HY702_00395 [Gemmatimonadetes bacterium]|nr:hypothetical protein [Gemmatimonadota bacterium]
MIPVRAIARIVFDVRDVERAERFHAGALGLPLNRTIDRDTRGPGGRTGRRDPASGR